MDFRPALVGEDGDQRRAVHRVARHHRQHKFYDWRDRYGKVNEHNGWILGRFELFSAI